MLRQLPILNIHGTDFIVDAGLDALRQVNNRKNLIRFADMDDCGDSYEFMYGKASKNLDAADRPDNENSFEVVIPQIVSLDPLGMKEKWKSTLDDFNGKSDLDVIFSSEFVINRIEHGRLPVIDILGDKYFVDIRMNELRSVNDFSHRLEISKMEESEFGGGYVFFYDQQSKSIIDIPADPLSKPITGVSVIEIPEKAGLDIHSYCRECGYDLESMIRHYPIQEMIFARKVPWKDVLVKPEKNEKRVLGDLIKKNRTNDPKKGKGL